MIDVVKRMPKKAKWYQLPCSGCEQQNAPPYCHMEPLLYRKECVAKLEREKACREQAGCNTTDI